MMFEVGRKITMLLRRFGREVVDGWLKKNMKKQHACGCLAMVHSPRERLDDDAAATCRRQKEKLSDDV